MDRARGSGEVAASALPLDQVPCHATFRPVRAQRLPALDATVYEYVHAATGAKHVHIQTADTENSFAVAFRTVPKDSTGTAHVLEHTVLCGSEKYPVRDLFFAMTRRSLQTFMNATTGEDVTFYPFSTQSPKDFRNLMRVYLDAVFFPKLNPLDLAQEGHRLEFSRPDDPSSGLELKGVVYSEMKGALSTPERQVWHAILAALCPSGPYRFNSGGDPADIPNLTHQQLVDFHRAHYHPSNATFFTYGNLPVEAHQKLIEESALSRVEKKPTPDAEIPLEPPFQAPRTVEMKFASDPGEPAAKRSHVYNGWLLSDTQDLQRTLDWAFFSNLLLGSSAAPLRKALETAGLGTVGELTAFYSHLRQAMLLVGLSGADPEKAVEVERLVLEALQKIADEGVPVEEAKAALQVFELADRAIGGSPNQGLKLFFRSLRSVVSGGPAGEVLNLEPKLEALARKIEDPNYVRQMARELLQSTHRVLLVACSDPEGNERKAAKERERLDRIERELTPEGKQRLIEQSRALEDRQKTIDDLALLPKVTLQDIPPETLFPLGETSRVNGRPLTQFGVNTNGVVYQSVYIPVPRLEPELLDLLPIFARCVTEVGTGKKGYLQFQSEQAATTGGLRAALWVVPEFADPERASLSLVLSGSALNRHGKELAQLMSEVLNEASFNEPRRVRELVAQLRAASESQITNNGSALAFASAASGARSVADFRERWTGLRSIQSLRALDESLADDAKLAELTEKLERIRTAFAASPQHLVAIADPNQMPSVKEDLRGVWSPSATTEEPMVAEERGSTRLHQAWLTNATINHCAKAYRAVGVEHPDAPALSVLGPFLSRGFLHSAVRERGGAYGGQAAFDGGAGSFGFFSYRDPRLKETLADFDRSIQWLLESEHEPLALEEAILSVIQQLDAPQSPEGEARRTFGDEWIGRTPQARADFRHAVTQVSLDDLKRVARQYLRPDNASVSIVSHDKELKQLRELGLSIDRISGP